LGTSNNYFSNGELNELSKIIFAIKDFALQAKRELNDLQEALSFPVGNTVQ